MHLGVEVGRDVTHEQLLATHHAVIYGVGAASDRRLEVPGADRPGVLSATELVGWYNGHPDHAGRVVDLSHRRAVVIGNGNVALDVARILTIDPDALVDSEIAPAALARLRESRIEEVVVVGRRDAARAAFTLPELVGLRATPGVALDVPADEVRAAARALPAGGPDEGASLRAKLELLGGLPPVSPADERRRIALRFSLAPVRVTGGGDGAVSGVELERTAVGPDGALAGTGAIERLDAGLVIASIGYRGLPVGDLPYEPGRGIVPNVAGRVVDPAAGAPLPGTYVVGWIKRGPTGFIGTNKSCAQETVATLVEDHNAGRLSPPVLPPTGAPAPSRRRERLRALVARR